MKTCFLPGDILLPQKTTLEKWAVIACDQHTSETSYWSAVSEYVGSEISALSFIQPEGAAGDCFPLQPASIDLNDFFCTYPNSFVYVERQMLSGKIRKGVVGLMDLQCYRGDGKSCQIMATEDTVANRLSQRIRNRSDACVELSHGMLFCDDTADSLIGWVSSIRDELTKIYDFQLMLGGGRITGWLLDGKHRDVFQKHIASYCARGRYPYFAVGDGNHSVAAAKACYLSDPCNELARYTMVELVNIHDPAIEFLPIHRLVKECDSQQLLAHLNASCISGQYEISWYSSGKSGTIRVGRKDQLAVAALQDVLDQWLSQNPGVLDYIHEDDALISLSSKENSLGFLLPGLDKVTLFPYIRDGKVLPKKSFSIGHACEKRYYLEGRKIK